MLARISDERTLDHPGRCVLYNYIREHPGEHYGGIGRATGIQKGTLAYHLRVMERANLVRVERRNFRKLYFAVGGVSVNVL